MSANNIPEEIEALARKLVKDPASRLFLPLAEKYRDAGMLEEAEMVLRDGLTHHPDYVGAHFSLGRVLQEKGDIDAAFGKFREVVKSAPDNLLAHKKLAEIALKKDLISEALENLRMVVRLNPSDEQAQELIDRYDTSRAKPAKTGDEEVSPPVGSPTGVEAFMTPGIVAEPFSPPRPDVSAWLSGPGHPETMPEIAAEPLQTGSTEGIPLPCIADEGGVPIDLSEFSTEPGVNMGSTAGSPLPDVPPVLEHVTTEGSEDDAYQLPAVEEIEIDKDLGIEIPTTLTPVEGHLEPDYSWPEPVSFEPAAATPEKEKSIPVHEIVDEEEETPSADIVAPPPPDENLQQLFTEIAGGPAPLADTEFFQEQAEEELETETVAELYIQQGHYEKARDIYGRLLLKTPGNSIIRQKLEELQFLINLISQKDPP